MSFLAARSSSAATRSRAWTGARRARPTYDLKGVTLMPGLIDAHAHLNWYFNRQGRYHTGNDGDTPDQSMLSTTANAYATLMAGFTTIQSPGAPEDKDLRDWIAAGQIPGPRVITSLNALSQNPSDA